MVNTPNNMKLVENKKRFFFIFEKVEEKLI